MADSHGYFEAYADVLRDMDVAAAEHIARLVFSAWDRHRTVFVCGNGGNASNASHIAMDLVKLTASPTGRRLRAVALGEGLAGLTAAANDIAYAEVFVEQLKAFQSPGDLVIGLSTSGSSPNVLRAIEYAGRAGAATVGITGAGGAALRSVSQFTLVIPSTSVQHIEDATMAAGHMVCLRVRDLIAAASHAPALQPMVRASAADRTTRRVARLRLAPALVPPGDA